MNNAINLVADYKDTAGHYYHQAFKVYNAHDEQTAAASLIMRLNQTGFIPCAIAVIYGNHTMEELTAIQNRPPVPGTGRLLYLDKANY